MGHAALFPPLLQKSPTLLRRVLVREFGGQGKARRGGEGVVTLAEQEGMAERNRDVEADRQTDRLRRHRRALRRMHIYSPIIRNLVDRVAEIYTPAPIRYSASQRCSFVQILESLIFLGRWG